MSSNATVGAGPRAGYFPGWTIVIMGVVLMAVVFGTIINIFSVFAKPVAEEIGATIGQFSLAYSVITLAAVPMSPVIGNVLKKIDARYVVSAGLALAVLANVVLSRATSIAWVYGAAVLQGIALIAATTIPISVMITNWFVRHRGMALGIATAGSGLGSLIFIPLVRFNLIPTMGWRNSYLVIAVIQAVLIPLAFFLLRNTPEQKGLRPLGWETVADATGAPRERRGLRQGQVYKTLSFWLLGAALIFSGVSVNGMISVLDPMLQAMQSPPAVLGWILASLGIFVMVGKFLTGWLFDKMSLIIAIGIVSLANAAQFFFMLAPTTILNGMLFSFLHGFGATMVTVTPAYLAAKLFGDRDYAAVYGAVSMFATGGAVAAAPFGLLFYTGETGNPTNLVWAWLVMGLIGFALYLFTVWTKPKWETVDA